ncbi:MAG TPA: GNAT family N-acetyltransferase [Holophagaceae bacterium]|nr:GNAT family N-acetyltransferase [Holophagaceae bacterium]
MIRPATPNDAARLAELSGQLGYAVEPAALAPRLSRILSDPDHTLLVAEEAGRVEGWIHAFRTLNLESAGRAEIGGLVVDEAMRSRGLGAALMAAVETWARGLGLAGVRLRSRVQREGAHAFYHRLGYEEVKRQVVLQKPL